MKHPLLAICVLGISSFFAGCAQAGNSSVEEALGSRPDLSSFYQALADNGVLNELQPNIPYTIFAPTNDAFDALDEENYPCFYFKPCKDSAAQILRNHFIPEYLYISDAIKHKGSLIGMNNRFMSIDEPMRGRYTIEGHEVTSMQRFGDVTLYTIDGVIANPHELAAAQYIPDEQKSVISTERKTIPDPSCAPAGCPDSATTVMMIISPEIAPSAESPAK